MRRRDFVALLGSTVPPLVLRPFAARAQPARMQTVGVLVAGDPDPRLFLKVFRDSLRDLGYLEGQNVRLEIRSAEAKPELLPELAAELVRRKVDIIVAWQTPTARAAKHATTEIPIVMASGDPVGTGLIASLAKPGGNVTGMSGVVAELAGKSVELIREMLPSARRLAALCNADDPFPTFLDHVRLGARGAAMELEAVTVRGGDELESSFPRMREQGVHAVVVQPSLPIGRAAELALKAHLPAFSVPRSFAVAGGLMAYAGRAEDQFRQVATYVDKILRGAKPGDLPVEQPSRFDLIVNLKTAKSLGLTIPPLLLARADEIIE